MSGAAVASCEGGGEEMILREKSYLIMNLGLQVDIQEHQIEPQVFLLIF